jgi:hypothetical protein
MKTKIIALFVISLSFMSCATAPPPRQITNAFQIENSHDAVWQALIETFAELNLPIQNMEKDSGLIVTDWIDFTGQTNEDYADCGGLGINIEVNRVGKFNVFVKKITENTCEIKVNTMYEQTMKFGDSLYKRKCNSTGKLEAEIFNLIKTKIGEN